MRRHAESCRGGQVSRGKDDGCRLRYAAVSARTGFCAGKLGRAGTASLQVSQVKYIFFSSSTILFFIIINNTSCFSASHQQHRVRAASVSALGALVLAAGGEALEYTSSHLAQRLFDSRPSVRQRLAQLLGEEKRKNEWQRKKVLGYGSALCAVRIVKTTFK